MPKIAVHRKAYTRKDGTHVKSSTFKIRDRGESGKTSDSERWYNPKVHTGWRKADSASTRRSRMLHSHKGNKLAAGRACQALANVTTDRQTKKLSRADALYFYDLNRKGK